MSSEHTPTPEQSLARLSAAEILRRAYQRHILIPAFNIAYLPMIEPVLETLREAQSFALLEVARPDIERFGATSYQAVAREFNSCADRSYARLHQDHVPVIDEEGRRVNWQPLVAEALALGYDSVMIDGSRLPLEENIAITRAVVEMAHPGVAVEAELGAVLGHEPGPLPSYEELFQSGRGFTDPQEAALLVNETSVDWLSVAVGNIHGPIIGPTKDHPKLQARLHLHHLRAISHRVNIPLVLHGGTGIDLTSVLAAAHNGIAKINIGTALRQPYEHALSTTHHLPSARKAVARVVAQHLRNYHILGSALTLAAPQ